MEANMIKQLLFAIILGLISLGIMSCGDNNTETPRQYVELGITGIGSSNEPLVMTDSEKTLRLSNLPDNFDFENDQRVLLDYVIKEEAGEAEVYDYLATVYSIQYIVLKDIMVLDDENRDTIGTDQISLNKIWVASDLLNLDFSFFASNKMLLINIVKDPEEQSDDPTEVFLQVRHDANGDQQHNRHRGIMSFNLEPLQIEESDTIKLIFELKDFYSPPFTKVEVDYHY
jgi:hypothetical protein